MELEPNSLDLNGNELEHELELEDMKRTMVCYLKWEASSGPISFEVQRNDIWTDNLSLKALGTRAIIELTRWKCKWKGN